MLPLAAEAQPVIAYLPAKTVGQLVGTQHPVLRHVDVVAKDEVSRDGGEGLRPTDTDAGHGVGALLGRGNSQPTAVETVGVAEVVDLVRGEYRGQAPEYLRRDVARRNPVRRHGVAVAVEVVVVVRTESHEGVVLIIHPVIELDVGSFEGEWLRERAIKLGPDRMVVAHKHHTVLVVILAVEKEERPVLLDWAADASAHLPPRKEWIRRARIT